MEFKTRYNFELKCSTILGVSQTMQNEVCTPRELIERMQSGRPLPPIHDYSDSYGDEDTDFENPLLRPDVDITEVTEELRARRSVANKQARRQRNASKKDKSEQQD